VRLPLTLAIMDGLLLRVGEQSFVVPLSAILESFRPDREQCRSIPGHGEIVRVRGEVIPLVRLHAVLGVDGLGSEPWQALVVLVETGSRRLGLLVDELVGQAQIVVKSLETHYRRVEGVTGATILGDGRIALILDVESIARQVLPRAYDASTGFVGGGDHVQRQLQS
jgi:two-component system chemotaxis sensor kinase CheA